VKVNNTIVRSLLCLLALVVSAVAADQSNFTIIGRSVVVKKPSKVITPNVWNNDQSLTTIAGNLSDFPFGVYFSLYNYYVTGSNNTIGVPEYWQGVPFTPSANVTVMEVDASVVWAEGTNEVVLSLYGDANGLPGTSIHTWHVKNLAGFGSCCKLAQGKSTSGIPLTGGKQYWVVAKTDSTNSDVFDGWDLNTTDMRSHPIASHCKGTVTQCGTDNNKWFAGSAILPGAGKIARVPVTRQRGPRDLGWTGLEEMVLSPPGGVDETQVSPTPARCRLNCRDFSFRAVLV